MNGVVVAPAPVLSARARRESTAVIAPRAPARAGGVVFVACAEHGRRSAALRARSLYRTKTVVRSRRPRAPSRRAPLSTRGAGLGAPLRLSTNWRPTHIFRWSSPTFWMANQSARSVRFEANALARTAQAALRRRDSDPMQACVSPEVAFIDRKPLAFSEVIRQPRGIGKCDVEVLRELLIVSACITPDTASLTS
jgi:hypothetical protein